MVEPRYALSVGKQDEERLQILNEIYNPSTFAFLQKAGIQPGMSVLDVGCGTGIVSCEIAKMVGPHGHVTCVDISPDQLNLAQSRAEREGLSNLEFVSLSAGQLSQLNRKFHLAYCRFLLMHLKDPLHVLEQLLATLSEKGVVVVEEGMGLHTIDCLPEKLKSFNDFYKIAEDQYKVQQSDSSIGRILPHLLMHKGLALKNLELFHPVLQTAREKSLLRLGIESIKSKGVEKQRLAENLEREIEKNPHNQILYFEIHRIAARKK